MIRPEKEKILFIRNMLTDYTLPFFQNLKKHSDFNILLTDVNPSDKTEEYWYSEFQRGDYVKILKIPSIGIILEMIKGNYSTIVSSLDKYSIICFSLSKLLNLKFFLYTEDWGMENENPVKRMVRLFLIKKSDAVLVPGQNHYDYISQIGAKRIHIVPNSKEGILTANEEVRNEVTELKGKNFILYVGRMIERKGVLSLILSYELLMKELLNPPLIVFVGTGPELDKYKLIANNIDVSLFNFLGHCNGSEIEFLFMNCLFSMVPSESKTMKEPWGFVVNESMYYGKPVVITDCVGADLVIDDYTGYVVKSGDINELKDKMKNLIIDVEKLNNLSANCLEIITRYTYDEMVKQFLKAFDYYCE